VVSRTAGLQDCYFVISVRRIVFSSTFDRTGVTGLEGTGEMVTTTKYFSKLVLLIEGQPYRTSDKKTNNSHKIYVASMLYCEHNSDFIVFQ